MVIIFNCCYTWDKWNKYSRHTLKCLLSLDYFLLYDALTLFVPKSLLTIWINVWFLQLIIMLERSLNYTGINVLNFYIINKMASQNDLLARWTRHTLPSWLPVHMTLKVEMGNLKVCSRNILSTFKVFQLFELTIAIISAINYWIWFEIDI